MTLDKKLVFVITGAAGSGKTTVRNYLHEKFNMTQVITHTTRAPRDNEKNGIDYYFETPETFSTNHYLESVSYAGHQYGSSYEGLQKAWRKSRFATIVLDTAGAITYTHELDKQVVVIFLKVTDPIVLKARMAGRGDATDLVLNRIKSIENIRDLRLPTQLLGKAYQVVNNDWEITKDHLDRIVKRHL